LYFGGYIENLPNISSAVSAFVYSFFSAIVALLADSIVIPNKLSGNPLETIHLPLYKAVLAFSTVQ
jgi:hypothetical protein